MARFLFWVFKIIFLPISLLFNFRCGNGYKNKEGKITYNGKEINVAEMKDFVVLNDAFAKDSMKAYYRDEVIANADSPTFEALTTNYAKDKNRVYYCTKTPDPQYYFTTSRISIVTVNGAIPSSFKMLGENYGVDKKQGYFYGEAFAVKDPPSLTVIDLDFVKDNLQVYYRREAINGCDPKSFEPVDKYFVKDSKNIYYYGVNEEGYNFIKVMECEAASFVRLEEWYSKDKISAFFKNHRIEDSDGESFEVLSYEYAKDKAHVYLSGKKIVGADPRTFTQLSGYYSKDKNKVFFRKTSFPVTSVSAFEVFEDMDATYAKDNKQVYYEGKVVRNADILSFKVYPHGFGNADSEDKFHKYYKGKIATDSTEIE